MKGRHEITVSDRRIKYKFSIERNITILRGNSATGKTTLIEMIAAYTVNGPASGVSVVCDKRCVVLTAEYWQRRIDETKDSIVFIDEGENFVKSTDFADCVKNQITIM